MLARRSSLWFCTLALTACGAAGSYVDDQPEREADWQEVSGEQIPPPVSQGWPIRGGDADSDEQRVACIQEVDTSRIHVSRAIDSANAIGNYDRVRCLSEKAATLKALRLQMAAPSLGEEIVDVGTACIHSQRVVFEARACL